MLNLVEYSARKGHVTNFDKMKVLKVSKWEVFERADGSFATFPFIPLGEYEKGCVPAGHCAGYARRVANGFYSRKFEPKPAWDFRHFYQTIPLKGFRDLARVFREGRLEPGFLIGLYNHNSNLNGTQKDMHGRLAPYTHVAVFLGENTENQLVFGQQVIDLIGLQTDLEMRREGTLRPREVISDIPIDMAGELR